MTVNRLNGYVSRFAFVQVVSFLMVFGINLSFFLFAHLLGFAFGRRIEGLFRVNSFIRFCVLLFMLGAALSTFHNAWEGNTTYMQNSMRVLPNYIYWGLIMLLFTGLAHWGAIDYTRLFKAIAIAVIVAVTYYTVLQNLIADRHFFKYYGPNNFSFLLICFTPYLIYFLRQRIHIVGAVLVLIFLLYLQLKEGRRAGFGLVFGGGTGALFINLFKFNSIPLLIRAVALMGVGMGLLFTEPVEKLIQSRSARVYTLIYENSNTVLSTDRSFLIRKAMVEKGFVLFRENILFGVGLNNFTKVEVAIEGDFAGSEFVMRKNIYRRVSSHNSYINILAEGGLFLALPFYALMLALFFGGLRLFGCFRDPEKVIFFAFCGMLFHLYFTNGIVNSLAWFNIGLMSYVVLLPRQRNSIAPTLSPLLAAGVAAADTGSDTEQGNPERASRS